MGLTRLLVTAVVSENQVRIPVSYCLINPWNEQFICRVTIL